MKRRTLIVFVSLMILCSAAPAAFAALSRDGSAGLYRDTYPDQQNTYSGLSESGGILDGSLVGSLVSGSEFTGIGMVDIVFFALAVFAVLSLTRVLRSRPSEPDTPKAPPSRHTMPPSSRPRPTGAGMQPGHDPWARLRSVKPDAPPSAPRPPAAPGSSAAPSSPPSPPSNGSAAPQAAENTYAPAVRVRKDFDQEEFLKGARILFARLQESFDRRDFDDIALFATPEVVTEMRAQAAKEGEPSVTNVMLVKASLLSLNVEDGQEVAEVYFDVLVREGKKAEPVQIKEVWYFIQPMEGNGFWQLDGIRQMA